MIEDPNAQRYLWLREALYKSAVEGDDTMLDKLVSQDVDLKKPEDLDACIDIARKS
jgi:hypothetical protein